MGKFLYSFSLLAYHLLIKLMSPFVTKAELMIKGRRKWREELLEKFSENKDKVVWFHSPSLGEFEQARPLMEKFYEAYPSFKILLTFYSSSGYEVRKNFETAYHVSYLPFDNKNNAKYWLETVNPSLVFFTKYDFWFYYSEEIRKRSIPLISFSSIFREDQIFFKWYGGFNRRILKNFTFFFVQNEHSLRLLSKIGIANAEVVGDTRFDRVVEIANNRLHLENIDQFKRDKKLFVCGSVWEADIKVIAGLVKDMSATYNFVIAPHEVDEANIGKIVTALNQDVARYNQFDSFKDENVMVLDTVGVLSSVYGYADIAFVGGAFGKGLHNILEAAVFKIPVFFGNVNYKKFNEALELIQLGAAFPVGSDQDVKKILNILQEKARFQEKINHYFESRTGATKRILEYCQQFLNP